MEDIYVRYKAILDREGLTGVEMAKRFGISYSGYKSRVRPGSDDMPKWVLSFVLGYEMASDGVVSKIKGVLG